MWIPFIAAVPQAVRLFMLQLNLNHPIEGEAVVAAWDLHNCKLFVLGNSWLTSQLKSMWYPMPFPDAMTPQSLT